MQQGSDLARGGRIHVGMKTEKGQAIYLLLFFPFNNSHDLCILFVIVNFLLWLYLVIESCVRFFGSVTWMYTMWAVHCFVDTPVCPTCWMPE